MQVIDNKGEAYQVKFKESLNQFSTELTRVITPLKDELKQEMNLKLAELRLWVITSGIAFIAATLTLLVSGWEKLYNALCQVGSGGPPDVILLCLIVVSWGVYSYFQNKRQLANESMKTILRLEARVEQLSQAQGTAASNVSPA